MLPFGGLWLILEALGITLEANALHFCSPWSHIGIIWPSIGSILGSCGCQNISKRDPECYFADLGETSKTRRVFEVFEGWRHPSWHQNGVLEALEACLGADEVCGAVGLGSPGSAYEPGGGKTWVWGPIRQ